MQPAAWLKPLQHAIAQNTAVEFSRYVQLASVTPDGMPSCRTVVFRGFRSDALVITTDARSDKVAHFRARPFAEVAWYFPLTKEQFRLFGTVVMIEGGRDAAAAAAAPIPAGFESALAAEQFRLECWLKMPEDLRLTFDNAPPGRPKAAASHSDLDKYAPQVQDTISPHFTVLLLVPTRVDQVLLPASKPNPKKPAHYESILQPSKAGARWLHTLDGGTWVTTEINP